MVRVTAELRVKAGRQAELEGICASLAQDVQGREAGCHEFRLNRSLHDPQSYLLLERYADEAALQAHIRADHYTKVIPALMECLEEPPRVALFTELDAAETTGR